MISPEKGQIWILTGSVLSIFTLKWTMISKYEYISDRIWCCHMKSRRFSFLNSLQFNDKLLTWYDYGWNIRSQNCSYSLIHTVMHRAVKVFKFHYLSESKIPTKKLCRRYIDTVSKFSMNLSKSGILCQRKIFGEREKEKEKTSKLCRYWLKRVVSLTCRWSRQVLVSLEIVDKGGMICIFVKDTRKCQK